MTATQIQATYFSPMMYFIYLFLIFIVMILIYQWVWTKKCTTSVKVLVVKHDGSTDTDYAPKTSGYVALKAPNSDTTRLWPINRLSTIEEWYPGDGFIPRFLQKKIKTVIVDEEDWEPLLNRGSYSTLVASPDVIEQLEVMVEHLEKADPKTSRMLKVLVDSLSAAPTREMVASPAVLGNLMAEKVSELAVTISKETFDRLEGIAQKLANLPNAMILYIGLGLNLVLLVILLIKLFPATAALSNAGDMAANIDLIKKSLGIP